MQSGSRVPHCLSSLCVVLLAGAVLAAQQPAQTPFRSRVDAIELELRVFDRAGNPITDLDSSEVEVLEDGRRREILAFARVSVPHSSPVRSPGAASAMLAADVATNRVAASSRIFVLVMDDLHVDKRHTAQVKRVARQFVEQHVQPGDMVSVVYTGVRPDAAQDFTLDRQRLLAAIDKFIGRKLPPATVTRMEQYNLLYRARGAPEFEDLRDTHDAERAFNARSAMASIESISTMLARVTGRRKAMILFSEGLDYDLSGLRSRGRTPGAAPAGPTVLPSTAPTGGSERDAVGRPDVHSYAHDVLLSLQAAMGAAARANVVLYPISVQGGNAADAIADLGAPVADVSLGLTGEQMNHEMRDAQETLVVLATNTGGFAALTPSDYTGAFERIVRESSEYYLLAYSPWNIAPDGTFRNITVNVNRPDVRVSARRGYYAPRQPVKRPLRFVGDGVSDETSALVMTPIPSAGLSLDVHAIAYRLDRKRSDVVVTVHVDGAQLAGSSVDGLTNTLELALVAIDSAGRVQAATARALDINLDGPALGILRQSGYRVVSRIQVPPGRYQVRHAIRERTGGRAGSVFSDIDVPDFRSPVAMSGILLTSLQANAVPSSIDPETYMRLPVLPSARRTFSQADEIIATVEIYSALRNRPIDVVTTVVDALGGERYRRTTRVSPEELGADGLYRHAVQIPLHDAGRDLALSVQVMPAGSPRDAVARQVAFTVTRD